MKGLWIAALIATGCGSHIIRPFEPVDPTNTDDLTQNLIVQYLMNEGTTDPVPTTLLDNTTDPLNLPITRDVGDPVATDNVPQSGLNWARQGDSGWAGQQITGTKVVSRLVDSTAFTYEFVVATQSVSNEGSRIVHIGTGANSVLSVEHYATGSMAFKMNGETGGWDVAVNTPRSVFHVIVDTTLDDPIARVKLFQNAMLLTRNAGALPEQNETIPLGTNSFFVIGNREIGLRSIAGTIYYVAMLDVALTADQVAARSAALLLDDDTPP